MSHHSIQIRTDAMRRVPIALLAATVPLLLALVWIALPQFVARAAPSVIRVTHAGASSGPCGDSWANPCDLQYALNTRAVSGTEIWVAAGLYKPTTISTNISATFALSNGVALYGGFAMTETMRDQRNWAANVTVLSGDIDNNDVTDAHGVITQASRINGSNSYHVVVGSGTNNTTVLDGFTVTGGNANGSTPNDGGGGLYEQGGNATIRNVTFSGNAGIFGGGVYNLLSTPVLITVTLAGTPLPLIPVGASTTTLATQLWSTSSSLTTLQQSLAVG